MTAFGYAGEIIKVDLSDGKVTRLPTADYADRFLGGRGMSAKLYWDMVPPDTGAFDADNCLIYATGPLAGFTRLGGCRWTVSGKTASFEPEAFTHANLGGSWGTQLKLAGYDALVVQGKSDKPIYLYIHDGKVEIKDATHLRGKNTFETFDSLKSELGKGVRVVAIGQAGENLVAAATILGDEGASGSSGLGAVMGSKKLKAIAVAGDKRPVAADPERLRTLADRIFQMNKGIWPNDPLSAHFHTKKDACYGCVSGCMRESYLAEDGKRYKYHCQTIDVYRRPSLRYYDAPTNVILKTIRHCDGYGLDTCVMQPMIEWLIGCYKGGILTEAETGLPLSKIGSEEFIDAFMHKLSYREGFGDVLAQGIVKAARAIGKGAEERIYRSVYTRGSETRDYDPRMLLACAILLAMEPRRPISALHGIIFPLMRWYWWLDKMEGAFVSTEVLGKVAEKFWGGAGAVDFSTYEGKALTAKKVQDRTYFKESMVLCDMIWPITTVRYSEDHVGDPTLESQVLSAVTGREIDEAGLNWIGERIFNLQRAIMTRQGWGGRGGDVLMDYLYEEPLEFLRFDHQCRIPGKNGEVTSRKGEVVDRAKFKQMMDEYYALRQWDVTTGLPTAASLEKLDLGDIARDMKQEGLIS